MARRNPRGQYVKLTVEAFMRTSAGAAVTHNGIAGQFPSVILYNDATHGELLQVNAVHIWPNGGNTTSYFALQKGLFAGAATPTANSGQLAGAGAVPGTVYKAVPTSLVATPCSLSGDTGRTWEWLPDWPICILVPGWSFIVQSSNSGNTFAVGLWWTALKGE